MSDCRFQGPRFFPRIKKYRRCTMRTKRTAQTGGNTRLGPCQVRCCSRPRRRNPAATVRRALADRTHSKDVSKIREFSHSPASNDAGGRFEEHRTEERISVQCVAGRIRFRTAEQSVELSADRCSRLKAIFLIMSKPFPTVHIHGASLGSVRRRRSARFLLCRTTSFHLANKDMGAQWQRTKRLILSVSISRD